MSDSVLEDAGGTIDYATQLGIAEVVDAGTEEQSTRVLYASLIDKDAVSKHIDNLYALTSDEGLGVTSSNLIGENDAMMSLTNSTRFYTGETAVAQFTSMGEVNTKINDLLTKIDTIYNNKETILKKIDSYNEQLLELKKNCRLNLLQAEADKWNAGKHDLPGSPTSHSGEKSVPKSVTEWGWAKDEVIFEEATNVDWYDVPPEPGKIYGRVSQNEFKRVNYQWHKYNVIQYWVGFKNIFKFWDPGFEEVEVMFKDAGVALPYDPALIEPKTENK